MSEIKKIAISYIQDFAASYCVYLTYPVSLDLYKVVDTSESLAQNIVYTIESSDYQYLKRYLKIVVDYIDINDDLYKLAVRIANLV